MKAKYVNKSNELDSLGFVLNEHYQVINDSELTVVNETAFITLVDKNNYIMVFADSFEVE